MGTETTKADHNLDIRSNSESGDASENGSILKQDTLIQDTLEDDLTLEDEDDIDLSNEDFSQELSVAKTLSENDDALDILLKELESTDLSETDIILDDEDEFDSQSDEEFIENIIKSLKEKGFVGIDNLSFDVLEVLYNRAEIYSNEGKTIDKSVSLFCSKIIEQFNIFCEQLNASAAVNLKSDDDTRQLTKFFLRGNGESDLILRRIQDCINNNFSDDIDAIIKTGESFSQEKINEIVNYVYFALQRDSKLEEIISDDYDRFIQNVKTTLNSIINLQSVVATKNKMNAIYRYNTSKYLLQDELKMVSDLKSDLADGEGYKKFNVCFIKQIFRDGDNYTFQCEKCDTLTQLTDPVAINLSFPVNGAAGRKSILLPRVYTCSCGQKHYFAEPEFNALEHFVKDSVLGSLSEFTKKLIDMSDGSALLKYKIPMSIAKDVWSYLVISHSDDDDIVHEEKKDDDIFKIKITSNAEFKTAVDNFYALLNTFDANKIPKIIKQPSESTKTEDDLGTESNLFATDPFSMDDDDFFNQVNSFFEENEDEGNENGEETTPIIQPITKDRSDLISYKEIATYFCKVLSIDYNTVKNKALFSLVFTINNNKVLSDYLNQSNECKLESILKYIDSCSTSLEKGRLPDDEQLVELVCIANFYGEDGTLAQLEALKDDKGAYCKKLLSILTEEKETIKTVLKNSKNSRIKILNGLKNSVDSLAFSQIINISQYDLKDIINIVADTEIYELFDLITDRMIITNYAEDFYDKYKTFKIFNTTTLKRSLVVGTNSSDITLPIQKWFLTYAKNNAVDFTSSALHECFSMVDALTPSNLSILRDLNKSFNDADYYEFCKVIVKIHDSEKEINTLISREYTKILKEFINASYDDAHWLLLKYKTAEDYYLQHFSQDERTLAKLYKEHLHFSRYMPVRKKDEGITDYLDRYESLLRDNKLTKYNSEDFGKGFDKYVDFFGFLFSCASLYETAYHSFTIATFITQFIKVLTLSSSNKSKTTKLLGISEPILNLIDYEISNNTKVIDFTQISLLLKTLSGIYVTSMKTFIDTLITKINACTMKNTSDLVNLINKFDMKNWLIEVAGTDQEAFVPYEDIPDLIDYNDAIAELFKYTDYEKLEVYL